MKQIKELREATGFNPNQLARKWKIARQSLAHFEQEERIPLCVKMTVGMLMELPPEEREFYLEALNAIPWSKAARKQPPKKTPRR